MSFDDGKLCPSQTLVCQSALAHLERCSWSVWRLNFWKANYYFSRWRYWVWADGGIVMVTVAVAILVVVAERGLAVVVHDGETGRHEILLKMIVTQ